MQPIELRQVRFKVYHGGMGADIGQCLHVAAEWAERAIAAGIVDAVEETPTLDLLPIVPQD